MKTLHLYDDVLTQVVATVLFSTTIMIYVDKIIEYIISFNLDAIFKF
ncbi:hypothetical protein HYD61_03270 [Mycoplasmopsis bovis]|nr:hypothetical protein HYD61_03270 [Mycoplasmopsis bovis]